MHTWSKEQKILLILAPTLVVLQIVFFQLFVHFFGDTWGYLLGYVVYWLVWCIPVPLLFLKQKQSRLWTFPTSASKSWVHILSISLISLPVIATFFAVFAPYISLAGWKIALLALLFALINAPLEERLWRGVFPVYFPHSRLFGFLYPTLFFGLWHLAPALAKDSGMDGGILSFVGGALFMGLLWAWYSYRFKTILPTTVAHILTNTFAFTGFLYVNWFS
ncbi:hypothetical protein BRE01_65950 [Brevibacillus reuszeri]|uniref:CAAX prenyl protease 2/Lysostaphin resistance protein A-like domain-containing protein n=1 Tax=Brevibacillus reuszeri TaxID=54915 RepID=A0A0K9YUE8_9BACL|nr:CPBP family glutamic-type intramembrane protease [Brevibacillus reuszeri]KNB72311.1 hypothetical protein ADS79_10475 [Brevibacillus reuszeri]MED1861042.1 CPBP family glutamic-type intramembrane protease [Brevibacillus reuszeri]GED72893.1 hypothetical protein BRE01_65950 [Brevibacillus reuszeri]